MLLLTIILTYINYSELPFSKRIIESILSGITIAMATIPEEIPVRKNLPGNGEAGIRFADHTAPGEDTRKAPQGCDPALRCSPCGAWGSGEWARCSDGWPGSG